MGQSGQGNSQYGTVWIFHPDFGARKVRSELMVAYLDQGWYKGKVLKACSPDKRFGRRITDERLEELRRWHSLYVELGFEGFVKATGYNKSKANLVQRFAKHVECFVPQNGKKR